jgi:predicted amidohydrolase YtcJ
MVEFSADLILRNGRVVTVDPRFAIASAVAVRRGRILAVGDESVASLAGAATRVIDLKGQCVVPGQVDAYSHFIVSGLDLVGTAGKVNITTLRSIDAILGAIAERVRVTKPGEWIATSCMYRGELVDGRWPNRRDLDSVAPNNPVYIMQGGRPIIANSDALRRAGIDRNAPDPQSPAGVIVRDAEGEPTGQLIAGAADYARRSWAKEVGLSPEEWDFQRTTQSELVDALVAQQKVFHACGVTATRDVGTVRREVGAFVSARRTDVLKTRTQLMIIIPERYLQTEGEFDHVFDSYFQPWMIGDDLLSIGGVAIDYSLDGWRMVDKPMLRKLVLAANRRGWTVAVTPGIGGEAEVNDVLEILEEANKENPIVGRRFPVMHPMGMRRPDQCAHASRLGVTLNPNPLLNYHAAARSVRMYAAVAKSGLLRSKAKDGFSQAVEMWGMPVRDWVSAGLRVSAGSNTPAAIYDPEKPFCGQYALCTGDTMAGALMPDQAVTRPDMLRAYTINGAFAMGLERSLGSIEVDKVADFVVLDRDILACADRELLDAKILMTFVGGELVYERAGR